MSTSHGLIIELSRNEKLQKYRIILSQHTNYLHKWLVHLNFDMFTAATFIFFCKIPKMWKPRTTDFLWRADPPLWKWASTLTKLAGDDECRLPLFHAIRNVHTKEIYHFSRLSHQTGCLFNQGSLLHITSSLFSQFCLFQNAILHKMLKLGFWNFNPIFLRIQFSLIATFFPLVLAICLSWYLYLKLSHEFLTFISFNI